MGRFTDRRRLGAGGMGVVYAAWDPQRKMTVAVKQLREIDAATLYRFKNEFRSLADLVHPNLVRLYELIFHEGEWAFSMELIDGMGFYEHVRPHTRVPRYESQAHTVPVLVEPPTL